MASAGRQVQAENPSPKHNIDAERQAYYERISKFDMAPLWKVMKSVVTKEPVTRCVPVIWRYEDVKSLVLESGGLISATVSSGANAANLTITNSGSIVLSAGGSATGDVISSGGALVASSGAHVSNTTVSSGGTVSVLSGGSDVVSTTLLNSGTEVISSGVTATSTQIDCGGIAKGYAVDVAIATLVRAGCSAGLVNAGGDLRAFGALTG